MRKRFGNTSQAKWCEAGVTIVEALVATAILGTMSLMAYSMASQIFKFEKRVRDMSSEDRMIASLMSNIRANLARHQYSMDVVGTAVEVTELNQATGLSETKLVSQDEKMLKNLPIAWSDKDFTDAANCPQCPGRLGYWIQPLNGLGFDGLLRVRVRVKHKQLYPDDTFRDYTFVSTFK